MRKPRSPRSSSRLTLALGLASVLVTPPTGPACAGDIDAAFATALDQSARLKAEEERLRATAAGLTGAKAAFLPTATASMHWTLRGDTTVEPIQPTGPSRPHDYGISVTQPIFDGGQRINQYRRSKAAVHAGRSMLTDSEQSVLLDTATAYLSVHRDKQILALREKGVGIVAGIVRSVRVRFDGGETTKTDIAQAESRLNLAKAELETARGELAASRLSFEKMTGRKPDRVTPPTLPLHLIPKSADDAVAQAKAANPKILAANFNSDAAGYAAQAAVGEYAPSMNLEVSRQDQYGYSSTIDRKHDFTVRVGVRIPILAPGTIPRIEEARAVARQKRYEAIDTRVGVSAAAATAFERYRASIARLAQIERQVQAAQAAVAGVRRELEAGQRTVMDILDAEQELVSADAGRIQATYERDYTGFVLIATMGRLTAVSLGIE